jgi:hypothetical protein
MGALTVSQDPDQNWDDLVRYREETEWPEGSKVEIVEGIITVSPSPVFRHNVIAERIQRRLYSVIPEDWGIFQTLPIAVPSRLGMLIPDRRVRHRRDPALPPHRPLGPGRPHRDPLRRAEGRCLPGPQRCGIRRSHQAPDAVRPDDRHRRVPARLTRRHPSTAATPTSTGTDTTVDSRIDSRARPSATR